MKIQELVVDLLLEILLRLPPEPINLCYASLVCKGWRGLVNDASFLRRFREFHGGTPPFLGFFGNNPKSIYDGVNNDQPPRPLFVPTFGDFAASTAAKMSHTDWRAHDSRHGRALLESFVSGTLLVWDLVTGDKHHLPSPHLDHDSSYQHNGTLLCAAGHTVTDHRDCRSCPFLVVYVFCPDESAICVCVWSSETGVWSEITSMEIFGRMEPMPPALVGNTLYWLLEYRCWPRPHR
ncbi:hypothetical protein ZWY2020_019151 [Hordeum vulgare]|nr:hypothetical protein ZWY2020_019151 [Hordeum vulgare]